LDQQVDRLIRVLKKNEYKDIRDEWKLITIFIGANNICVLCTPPMTTLPDLSAVDVFERNLRLVLERIRQDVGKSFVNLVGLFNVSGVYEATRGDPYCELIWDPAHMAICSCVQQDTKQRLGKFRLNTFSLSNTSFSG
jgi:lysophospholipase L1-like esterase